MGKQQFIIDLFRNAISYSAVIKSMMASQINDVSIVCVTSLFEGNTLVTGGFPSRRASLWKMFPVDVVTMFLFDPNLVPMNYCHLHAK